ncbi:hypothetical protein H4I95_04137 [Botrytis cinerea]
MPLPRNSSQPSGPAISFFTQLPLCTCNSLPCSSLFSVFSLQIHSHLPLFTRTKI